MSSNSFISRHRASLLPLLALCLSACGGSDGKDGEPGAPAGDPAISIDSLTIDIHSVKLTDGIPEVNFSVHNQDDEAVIGIPSARFIAAQLLPQGYSNAGDASQWQHFGAETCDANCPGTFTDFKNGSYSYKFSTVLDGMNGQSLVAGATERMIVKVGGDTLADGTALPVTNQHLDWTVAGNDPAYGREIVSIEACNGCHTDLAFHRGNYNQTQTCVSCHNLTRVSEPANVFAPMIHTKHLEGFPRSLSDCQVCHKDNDMLTERDNWHTVPTMEACGSCHTDIDFVAGTGHPAQANNSNCVACHNAEWTAEVHSDADRQMALAQFQAEITSASMDDSGTVTVAVKLSNPQTGEVFGATNTLSFVGDLRIYANWGLSVDYTNRSARNIRLHEVEPISGSNGSFTYQITGLTILPGTEVDLGTLAIQGRICADGASLTACGDNVDALPIKASHVSFSNTALSAKGRRTIVANDSCGNCHGDQQLTIHGARNDLEGQCQLCHNHNRTADATAANPSHTSVDFKQLIHALHGGKFEGFEELHFPSELGNCATCHVNNDSGVLSIALPLAKEVQPLALSDGSFTSATAAICSNCHEDEQTRNHMIQQGAAFAASLADATAGTESCATCHGQGGPVDVLKVHPIR
ncbi:OmcA/MtrC family decaheme c-type cytochrome [Shewanella sedimentimangrovi]|uniref:OmcA/MtrC family decaheme c-type cytochrome n=1 Tax=Shewanella sedimentimangrovi TaxID=2814293 RepID=A0ABX7R5K9_9GAMM|nr:OmcA/MtrC family decaheme c-type cytochrome [Shewanella sedimentimangrovi]QSX38455.1 OmcA/MtrC family decaheme c-type cytochrome [Shewanella sedimentimangrovi]